MVDLVFSKLACCLVANKQQRLVETQSVAQSSTLLTMPTEVLLEIFTQANAVDKFFLALTCKRLAAVASMIVITIPSSSKHRAARLSCRGMLSILAVMQPLDAKRRPLKPWGPCCDCYRYRPRMEIYWKGVWENHQSEWPSQCLEWYDKGVRRWGRKDSDAYQCPECWCEAHFRKYTRYYNRA